MKIDRYRSGALGAATLALTLILCGTAAAEGSITVREEIMVNAPARQAWAALSGFCDIAAWHPAVDYCDMDREQPSLGALRTLTLGNGAQLFERLTDYDAEGMRYSYTIPDAMGVLPVQNYTSTLRVESAGAEQSIVTWTGHFDPSDPANPGASEEVITGIYRDGLEQLRGQAETMR